MNFILLSILIVSILTASELKTISFLTNSGETTSLNAFKGQVLLIVNTASECGQTPQYAGLEKLYEKYKDRGFTVIAFPSNDFKKQEPGSNEEIKHFCTTTYGVTFPLMSKITVLGENKHPLYKSLVEQTESAEIEWNFAKFLLDRSGNVAARIHYRTKPDDPSVTSKIEELLGAVTTE